MRLGQMLQRRKSESAVDRQGGWLASASGGLGGWGAVGLAFAMVWGHSARSEAEDILVVRPVLWHGAIEPWVEHRIAQGYSVASIEEVDRRRQCASGFWSSLGVAVDHDSSS